MGDDYAQAWKAIRKSCEQLPVKKRTGPVELYSDIFDGDYIYNHPELGWRATPDGSCRLAFGLYYDGLNCVNTLGAFSGTHTIGLFYLQVYNLPPEMRQTLGNLFLVSVCYEHHAKYYGMEQLISGTVRMDDGRVIREPYNTGTSIGASLRRLHDGVVMSVPEATGWSQAMIRGWLVTLSADFPAAAMCLGTKAGTSAECFCRCVPRLRRVSV